ncbi:MAG: hypothetical protein IT258_22960 [Saprospiraceae bacterium]|nr:hypothetical protein [Saprospiraceae bacterium]
MDFYDIEVTDKASFLSFLTAMKSDFDANGEKWENNDLSNFLEAMVAWTEDMEVCYRNMKLKKDLENPDWSVFADILKASTIYE